MVIGADVSHAGAGSLFPSIAGLVGSLDRNFVKYVARCSPQPSRLERIQDIGPMLQGLFRAFYENSNKILPARIIFFRDGLSEGEFRVVAEAEIQEIKDAIKETWKLVSDKLPPPKLIYITAIKRHHIRLAPEQPNQGDRKSGNVFPGTTTGDDFAQPGSDDFFLVSHRGLLGTSRPTHYNVLLNEDSISVDDLKSFSNALCYDFARATCAVSQVTPVYYAHLVCKRSRIHLGPTFREDASEVATNASSVPPAEAAAELYERVRRDWKHVNKVMLNEMYFL